MADFGARGVTGTAGRASLAGRDHRGSVNSGETVSTPVTVIAPGLGIPAVEKRACLAALLPNGTTRYIALFTGLPDAEGLGGVEASGSGYARVALSAWAFEQAEHVVRRVNNSQVVFPTLTGDLSVIGWGVFDAAVDGDLKAFGRTRTAGGAPLIFSLANGDVPRFLVGELKVGIQ